MGYEMPKIPQLPIQKESRISNFRLATPGIKDIRATKARPTHVVSTGENFLAKGLKDMSKALKDVSEVFAEKEEVTRVAESQKLQMKISEYFRNDKTEYSKLVGGQALGLVEKLRGAEPDLREKLIPEGLDAKTTRELTTYFNRDYNRHALSVVNFSIAQSNIADKEARIHTIQNARTNITSLQVGDVAGLEQEVNDTLAFELARHPNLTDEQIETNGRSLREDYTTFALTKWVSDNPTGAVEFWNKNQVYIKNALPKTYNIMAGKMEVAKDDSVYDVALGTLQKMFGDDDGAAAQFVDDDDKGTLGLKPTQRLRMSALLWSNNNYKLNEEKRIEAKREEDYAVSSHDKFYNEETGVLNTVESLADLEQAYRDGRVSSSFFEVRKNKLLLGGEFSNVDSQNLMRDINSRKITTRAQILDAIAGTSAKPEPFYNEMSKLQSQIDKGYTTNWFDVVEKRYIDLSKIDKPRELPSGLAEKELLVDITKLGKFKLKLEAEARRLGYAATDPRIEDLGDKMLEGGSYTYGRPEFRPGKAPWNVVFEKYTRRWQYNPIELLKEGKILRLPREARAEQWAETATGGNPENKIAIERLQDMGIPITPESIARAKKIIAQEEGGK